MVYFEDNNHEDDKRDNDILKDIEEFRRKSRLIKIGDKFILFMMFIAAFLLGLNF